MSGYHWDAAAHMFAAMDDATLTAKRHANIALRDAFDIAARRLESERNMALIRLKAAQAAYEEADRLARDAERAYSHAADDCCMGANEAHRRAEAARATLAAMGAK